MIKAENNVNICRRSVTGIDQRLNLKLKSNSEEITELKD